MATLQDVEAAIKVWSLDEIVQVKKKGGRAELIVDGEAVVYPNWLAVRKVNQIGAERGV